MSWYDDGPVEPPRTRAAEQARITPLATIRRGLVTAILTTALLAGGGVAVVAAATPDPSASPTPNAETQEPADDESAAPSESAEPRERGARGDCPEKDGSGTADGAEDDSDAQGSSSDS